MNHIEWQESWNTGVETFDREHRQLLELINLLYRVLANLEEKKDPRQIVGALLKYTEIHFKNEETYLEKHHYPHLETHKALHREFAEKTGKFKEIILRNSVLPLIDIFTFLKDWLTRHIIEVDSKYSAYFKGRGLLK